MQAYQAVDSVTVHSSNFFFLQAALTPMGWCIHGGTAPTGSSAQERHWMVGCHNRRVCKSQPAVYALNMLLRCNRASLRCCCIRGSKCTVLYERWSWSGVLAFSNNLHASCFMLVSGTAAYCPDCAAGVSRCKSPSMSLISTKATCWTHKNSQSAILTLESAGSTVPILCSSSIPASLLVQVAGLHGITQLALGGAHTLALRQTDDVVACGANQNGVLGMGVGVSQDSRVPARVPKLRCSQVSALGHSLVMVLRRYCAFCRPRQCAC